MILQGFLGNLVGMKSTPPKLCAGLLATASFFIDFGWAKLAGQMRLHQCTRVYKSVAGIAYVV